MTKKFLPAICALFLFLMSSSFCYAAGPWKGRVIDAGTKAPLEGAVVLAVWERVYRTPAGAISYFYNAFETLTDKDGRFEIAPYTPINFLPLISYMRGPQFTIFKPGYGRFPRFQVTPEFIPSDFFECNDIGVVEERVVGERDVIWGERLPKVVNPNAKRPLKMGIVELPKLKTWEERVKNMPSLPSVEHLEKEKLLIKAMSVEEENLGLPKSDSYKAREYILRRRR